jgi:hypothetical protein
LAPASRGSLTHRFEQGANRAERLAVAMPAVIIINRSSGGRQGVLSNSFASVSLFNLKRLAKSLAFHFG